MQKYPKPITELVKRLSQLPGIGKKSATRLVLFLLHLPDDEITALGEAITRLKTRISLCHRCHTLTDQEICSICSDSSRDHGTMCVVEEPADLLAIEDAGHFRGVYHVLHGVISPLDGVGPEHLKIFSLQRRVQSGDIKEVILATNPTVEGEATAQYLYELLKDEPISITRIALGLPMGGDVKFTDTMTINKALESRSKM